METKEKTGTTSESIKATIAGVSAVNGLFFDHSAYQIAALLRIIQTKERSMELADAVEFLNSKLQPTWKEPVSPITPEQLGHIESCQLEKAGVGRERLLWIAWAYGYVLKVVTSCTIHEGFPWYTSKVTYKKIV